MTSLAMALVSIPAVSAAQAPADSVPVRDLKLASTASPLRFGLILNLQQLERHRVLVNDGGNRQLVVIDSALLERRVLLDSATSPLGSYGPRATPLIRYDGDSILFVDGQSQSLLVISPQGTIARTMSAPSPTVMRAIASSPSYLSNGQLLYRASISAIETTARPGGPATIRTPDSASIVRANFDSRRIDTIARLKLFNGIRTEVTQNNDGSVTNHRIINPISTLDEWAVTSDGSVAIVRGADYHIDWIHADGSRHSTSKLPFAWKRLSEDDKMALIDSARAAEELAIANARKSAPPSGPVQRKQNFNFSFAPVHEIADYQPAIRPGAVRADRDNRLWVLPSTSARSKAGELIYDVIDTHGKINFRVRVPLTYAIAGFGAGGTVYLMKKDGDAWSLSTGEIVE